MAQDPSNAGGNSYTLDDVTFPVGRSKLQSIFNAVRSTNKGSSAPDLVAGQFWIDDSGGSDWVMYFYDGSNNIQFATIDTSANTVNFTDSAFDLIVDTTPQLGGSLDVNGNAIISTSNANITITPNGSGKVVLDGISHPTADGTNGQVLTTNGAGVLSFTDKTVDTTNLVSDTSPQLGGNLDLNSNDITGTGNINFTGNVVLSGTVDGRDIATDGTKLDGIEASATADQSASEIRTLVDSASDSNVFTDADHSKLNAIEASADVTDTANVTASGALMDSEVTNLADVKSFDTSDYATSAQGTLATNALPKSGGTMTGNIVMSSTETVDGRDISSDGSKLDGIESGATADQTNAEIRTAVEAATDSNVFTDADHTKLNGIETGATSDQTSAEIKTAVQAESDIALAGNPTTTTQTAGNNSTRIATTAFVQTATASLVDSAPSALNTLNELAAALGDDANFSTTVSNSIGTKLPLAGGTMTGNIVMSGSETVDGRDLSADGSKLDGIETSATADQTASEIRTLVESATDSNVFTDADHTKLNGIETSADVTDTANVTSAGALMDSEVTNLSDVKSFDPSDYATAAQGTLATNALPKAGGTMTGNTLHGDNVKQRFGAANNLEIYADNINSYIAETGGSGNLVISGQTVRLSKSDGEIMLEATNDGKVDIRHDGSTKLETASGGIDVTGNIVVSGTVDGRDLATDGTKLDGIEASATADQTGAEIKSAYEGESDTNAFTDALLSKLNAIEASADVTDATNVNAAGAIMNSDVATKGQLIVGDGSGDPTILSVGTDGLYLKADSSASSGVAWATVSGGGGGSVAADDITTGDAAVTIATSSGNITIDAQASDADIIFKGTDGGSDITALTLDMSSEGALVINSNMKVPDNGKVLFGAGNDLQIYHNSSDAADRIESSNTLQLRTDTFRVQNAAGTETLISGNADGTVGLNFNDSQKLVTSNTGVTVTGTLSATTLSGAISGNISQLTNNSGYITQVTSGGATTVSAGNGIGLNTGNGTITMSGSFSGNFSATGNITAYSSDERLKHFKGKIENALDKVDKLNGYYYEWNDTAKGIDADVFKDGVEVGVNAQEVEAVMPEVVVEAPIVRIHELDTAYKTVHYDKLVPLLIESIKELKAEIEELKKDK